MKRKRINWEKGNVRRNGFMQKVYSGYVRGILFFVYVKEERFEFTKRGCKIRRKESPLIWILKTKIPTQASVISQWKFTDQRKCKKFAEDIFKIYLDDLLAIR